jgi:hypothetical protein
MWFGRNIDGYFQSFPSAQILTYCKPISYFQKLREYFLQFPLMSYNTILATGFVEFSK